MKYIIFLITLLLAFNSTSAFAQDKWVVRPNGIGGQPNMFAPGKVITKQANGSYRVKDESMIHGQENMFSPGQIVTPQADGSIKVQKESIIHGQPDMFDMGYTISPK